MSLHTTITTRADAHGQLQFVAHVIERRQTDRRNEDRLIARGIAPNLPELHAKLAARGFPVEVRHG